MKNITISGNTLVVGVIAAVVSAVVSSSVITGYIAYSAPGYDPSVGSSTANTRLNAVRPDIRSDNGTVIRSGEVELLEQERRVARLRALQEEEAVHAAATDEDEVLEFDARAHFRAYRHCSFRGYTRSRLHACIESVLQTGEYEITY